MGESSGGKEFVDGEAGCAMITEVKVVRRGMEAERRARREVCRRCGSRVRDYVCQRSQCGVVSGAVTNSVDACRAIFFRQAADLQGNLD